MLRPTGRTGLGLPKNSGRRTPQTFPERVGFKFSRSNAPGMDLELADTSALVTASSSGLGKASATALAREGANVVLNGRDEERLAEAVEEVDAAGDGEVVGVQGDLTEKEDIEHLVERTVEEFG